MNLLSLFDLTTQFQNKNGAILTSGKLYVYYLGRTQFAITYKDAEGVTVNPNPIILDNNGRAPVFVDSDYSYTLVVCDPYGEELFSQDITPCGTQGGSGGQGKTYYGGDNIEITQQNYINVTGRKTLAVMNPLTAYEDNNRCVIAIKDGTFLSPSSLDTKLDTTAFSTVSGSFLTAHQSLDGYLPASALNGYATVDWTSGMLSQKLDITAYQPNEGELEVSGGWGPGINDSYHSCTYLKDYISLPQKDGKYPKAVICNFEWASTDGYLSFFPCEDIGWNGTRSTAYSYDSSQYINDGFGDSNLWKNVCLNFTANSGQKMAYVAIKGGDEQRYSAKNVKYTCFY